MSVELNAATDNPMVFADEVVPVSSIEELQDISDIEVSDREVQMAMSLVDSLAGSFDPKKFKDTYREEVLALIDRKAAGEEFEAPEAVPERGEVIDLMAALEASVAAAKKATARNVSFPVLARSWRIGVGKTKTLPGPTAMAGRCAPRCGPATRRIRAAWFRWWTVCANASPSVASASSPTAA